MYLGSEPRSEGPESKDATKGVGVRLEGEGRRKRDEGKILLPALDVLQKQNDVPQILNKLKNSALADQKTITLRAV